MMDRDDQPTQAWPAPLAPEREQSWPKPEPRRGSLERTEAPREERLRADTPPPPTERVVSQDREIGTRPESKPAVTVRRLRRGRLAIRKIDPWAVLKFSLVFYFCMLLIFMLGTAVIFATLKAFGVIDNIEEVLRNLQINYTIAGGAIFRWMFLLGIAGTLVASAITVFLAFLYNLIADVVGGIELLVTERE
jgi:hypothetical protein